MGVTLFDLAADEVIFDVNFWHWRAIVEAIRSLDVLPAVTVDALHEPFIGELTEGDARVVAEAIRTRLLPTLNDDERLLLDGKRTTEPDDGTFHREPAEQHRNWLGSRRKALERHRFVLGDPQHLVDQGAVFGESSDDLRHERNLLVTTEAGELDQNDTRVELALADERLEITDVQGDENAILGVRAVEKLVIGRALQTTVPHVPRVDTVNRERAHHGR